MLTSHNSLIRSRAAAAPCPSATRLDAAHINVFPFTSLPVEIRDMIYEYCLHRGKIFTGRSMPRHWVHQPEKQALWLEHNSPPDSLPLVALLGLNRRTRIEAQRVFYSMNTFVVTADNNTYDSNIFLGVRASVKLVRSVEVICSHFDWTERDSYSDHQNCVLEMPYPLPDLETDLRKLQHEYHDNRVDELTERWSVQSERHGFLAWMKLERLQIDIKEAYCGESCCRLAESVAQAFSTSNWFHGLPKVIEITGAYDANNEPGLYHFDEAADVHAIIKGKQRARPAAGWNL